MSARIIVDDLIDQVRQQLAEENRESITDSGDILPALNRGLNFGVDILARQYPDPLLAHVNFSLLNGTQEYPIPEDALEQRLEKIEVVVNGLTYPVQKIDYKDVSLFETAQSKSVPLYWCTVGTKFRVFPNTINTYPLRLWYLKDPLPLVISQGRINILNTTDNYVIVDAVGTDLTTESDQLNSYVNLIDGSTGDRKASYQIQNIVGNKITFKTIPARMTVLDIAIDTALATPASGATIEADDYVTIIKGTCVPFMKKPMANFLVQYAVAEIRRKLGENDANLEQGVLKAFEDQIEHQWAGRSNAFRVQNRSNNWPTPNTRRLVITQG